jgi:hypothetical protein
MKRIVLGIYAALLMLLGNTVSAQYKLSEDFSSTSFPPTGWTQGPNFTDFYGIPDWSRMPASAYGKGSGSAFAFFYDILPGDVDSLVSPIFTPSEAGDSLYFDEAYRTYVNEVDELRVYISMDGGDNYTLFQTLLGGNNVGSGMVTVSPSSSDYLNPGIGDWVTQMYDLPVGVNRIKFEIYSQYGNNLFLDNVRVGKLVPVPPVTIPVFEQFSDGTQWGTVGDNLWSQIADVTGPSGNNDTAMSATFYENLWGDEGYLMSPSLDLSSATKPVMNFYVAYRNYSTEDDMLEVVVSTDGGITWQNGSGPLYFKSQSTVPSLSTLDSDNTEYYPASADEWRHETVDLSEFAGMSNVIVAFHAVSDFGNNLFIDNVNIQDVDPAKFTSVPVGNPGQTIDGYYSAVTFSSIGGGDGNSPVTFCGKDGAAPNSTFADNFTATAPDGSIYTPDRVFNRYVTITYYGNDMVRADYDVSMDITGLPGITNPDKLYIMKRCDQSGPWQALPTTRSGNILMSTGLNNFSDFAVGSDASALPVRLLTFAGNVVNKEVLLKWTTGNEYNNAGFDIERSNGSEWKKIGNVASRGNSTGNSNYTFTDHSPLNGLNYYRLKQVDLDGKFSYSNVVKAELRGSNYVYQNSPNPFRSATVLNYYVAANAKVNITVYDLQGKQVAVLADANQTSGSYAINWNAQKLSAGTYYYKAMIGNDQFTGKMVKVQ